MIFQRFARFVLRLVLMHWLTPCTVTGLEHVPRTGRLIVMMNHLHGLDPILVVTAMPRDVRIMSKIENLRLPFLGLIVRWFGSFPIRRGEADLQAMRRALQSLACEEALLMAPEGTRSKNGGLQEGRDGMALVAARAEAPILPVVIFGDEQFERNLKRLRRTPVQIRIGAPFRFGNFGERPSRAQLSEMTQEAMYRMAALLPETYRGVYSDLGKTTERYIVSAI